MRSQLWSRGIVAAWVVIAGCSGEVGQPPRTGEQTRALGPNLLQDQSFEDFSPRGLGPDDPTPWFGEEKNRSLILSGDARTGTQFARLTGGGPQAFLY